MSDEEAPQAEPPRIVLFALYLLLTALLVAVLVIVGVYGT